jgi:hypothetical protein
MASVLKIIFWLFILAGIAISLYGCREILGTMSLVQNATERAKGTFIGYDYEIIESRSASPSPTQWGQVDFQDTTSFMSYPRFEFVGKDGQKKEVREAKQHLLERFKPGQEVEIIVSPYGDHRLAGFYSLYVRDLCILILGLCFIFIPLVIWRVSVPLLQTPAGMRMEKFMTDQLNIIASSKLGPITVSTLMKGLAISAAVIALIGLANAVSPFVKQMHLGFGWGLMDALQKKNYDEARVLILKKKGIHKVNEYDQNPLLLALEAGQFDLACLLIEAGADVNIKSKMYKTPLQVAAQSGELEVVKLLLSKGASPDALEDELPPVFFALRKKHYEIARVLIESKCDLHRLYIQGNDRFTVGDLTVLARQPELTDLVRRRGGSFSLSPLPPVSRIFLPWG